MERNYVLFKNHKRVTVREDDMTPEKIGRIFQVRSLFQKLAMEASLRDANANPCACASCYLHRTVAT